ncbi:MAG: DUF397 domain-containing protein [Mycobacteriales bacterium]
MDKVVLAVDLPQVTWRKSHLSNPEGNCVEMALLPDRQVAVRNSRFPDGPVLVYTRAEIEALLGGVRAGDFDFLLD